MNEQLEATGELPALENPELVPKITELLRLGGHPRPEAWEAFVHPDAKVAFDPGIQRFLINRYWRETIGALEESTIDVRYCLVEEGSISDWARLFSKGVVKCIVDNNLPKQLH